MSVPDTNTFNLQNVVDEVNPTTDDLVDCFSDAVAIKFDPTYEGSKDRLLNFRNYGYRDWFLPSYDLLKEMYTNLKAEGVGDFSDNKYWSSSESSSQYAYVVDFSDGSFWQGQKGNDSHTTRACRSFTAGIGDYDIGDTGPAGGLICYIDSTTYYEAAPSDQNTGQAWSNIIDVEVGTDTAIGTGQANTTAIIDQDDHTTSAAKLCDDLVV